MPDFTGHYAHETFALEVVHLDGGLASRMFGVPEGYEIPLNPTDDPLMFVLQGGPASGAPVTFQVDGDTVTGADLAGQTVLERLDGPPALPEPHGQGLQAPPFAPDDDQRAAFDALLATIDEGRGGLIEWTLPYPKHEFLRYAEQAGTYIFHGSGDLDIEEFVPLRTSTEMHDRTGRGNVAGIYGTHDGLWPMFFAVVDRDRLAGSIRNGVVYFDGRDGSQLAIYNFSINRENLPDRPYRNGMLYILPRATFTQLEMIPGGPLANEWASEEPVRPLARLPLAPEDFPFLDDIGGHDDGPIVAHQEANKDVLDGVVSATHIDEGVSMALDWTEAYAARFTEWVALTKRLYPTVRLVLRFESDDSVWLDYFGQPAMNEVIARALDKRGVLD